MANPYQVAIELSMASNHAAVLGALSRSLLGVYPLVSQLTGHFNQLKLAIGGALGVATGGELLAGITKLVDKTKDLSHELTQLKKIGLTDPEIARVQAKAVEITRNVPGTTEIEALKIPGQTYSMLGLENSLAIAQDLAKFQSVIRNTTGKFDESDEKQLYQMLRSADLIGKLTDPQTHQVDIESLRKYLDVGSKVMLGTHGYVTPQTWLNMAQQGGPALMNLNDEGLLTMGIMSQAMGGHRAGTAMMSLFQQMAGGTMFKRSAEAMQELGLLGEGAGKVDSGKVPEGYDWGTSGGRVVLSEAASKRLAGKLGNDPLVFAENIKKALEEKGFTSNEDQVRQLFRILGRATSQRFTADELRNMSQIEQERGRFSGALGIGDALSAQNKGDVAQNLRNLTASWENFLFALAGPNSENAIAVLQKITGAINSITESVRGLDPTTVSLVGAGVAALAAVFVGAGAAALLAAIGAGGWLIAGIAGLGAAIVTLKASGVFDSFDAELNGAIEARHEAIVRALSSVGDWIYEGVVKALEKVRSLLPSWLGGVPSSIGSSGAGTLPPGVATPNSKLLEGLSGATRNFGTTPPAVFDKPVAPQGGSMPLPGGGSWPNFTPISVPGEGVRDLTNAIHQASLTQRSGESRPIVVSLNVDGRKLAEAVDMNLARSMEFPSQAPYHDSFAGWASPDQQFAST